MYYLIELLYLKGIRSCDSWVV